MIRKTVIFIASSFRVLIVIRERARFLLRLDDANGLVRGQRERQNVVMTANFKRRQWRVQAVPSAPASRTPRRSRGRRRSTRRRAVQAPASGLDEWSRRWRDRPPIGSGAPAQYTRPIAHEDSAVLGAFVWSARKDGATDNTDNTDEGIRKGENPFRVVRVVRGRDFVT